jgi:hypothetical protein
VPYPDIVKLQHRRDDLMRRKQQASQRSDRRVLKNVYKGPAGRVALYAQYEYLKREAFEGVGSTPSLTTALSIHRCDTIHSKSGWCAVCRRGIVIN